MLTGTPLSVSSTTISSSCSPCAWCRWPVRLNRPHGESGVGQVLVAERRPHLGGGHLAALVVGVPLDDGAELDLQPAGQVQVVLGLHDVGDAALAGLAVHPDHGLVAAADVLGVDRQVRDGPRHLVDGRPGGLRVGLERLEALADAN